jgi:hypothetical protein
VPGVHLALFADDTCIYASEKHEHCVLCKLHWGLTAVNSWCEHWNIKINERKTQVIFFSRRHRVPDSILQLNGWDIPFVNNVMYLSVSFKRRVTWRHHIERTVAKALYTYIRTYSLFESGCLNTNIELALYKALIGQLWRLPVLPGSMHRMLTSWNCSACRPECSTNCTWLWKLLTCMTTELILNHVNPNVHGTGQVEAVHWKYKRLKRGRSQAYNCSAD